VPGAQTTPRLFDRVVCGIDPGPEAAATAREVAALAPPDGRLVLAAVVQALRSAPEGWPSVTATVMAEHRTVEAALTRVREAVAPRVEVSTRMLEGAPIPTLLAAFQSEDATLAAVGVRTASRAAGIALGSVATATLHEARCSVFLARGRVGAVRPPRMVVGLDGSASSALALEAARDIAIRLGAVLRVLVALGGKHVDLGAVRAVAAELVPEIHERAPVDALARSDADLLVVGSRGLHGLRALGSVSERVAHRADSSVLVVRAR
jgi:nucleotide-binding universal stress UspA family protein